MPGIKITDLTKEELANEAIFLQQTKSPTPLCSECGAGGMDVMPVGYRRGHKFWRCKSCIDARIAAMDRGVAR